MNPHDSLFPWAGGAAPSLLPHVWYVPTTKVRIIGACRSSRQRRINGMSQPFGARFPKENNRARSLFRCGGRGGIEIPKKDNVYDFHRSDENAPYIDLREYVQADVRARRSGPECFWVRGASACTG